MAELNQKALKLAAADFLYLLDHEYPRSASLQLVGNRYNLDRLHREILHRGVFAREEAKQRRNRLVGPEELVNRKLLVDGHNVIITTESRFAGRPLIAANDGFIRDVAGISHRYRISPLTHEAIDNIFRLLHNHPPSETLFFLDAPIRQSGQLAAILRTALKRWNLTGDAQALKVPEKELIGGKGIVASSDSAILDGVEQGFDLAAVVIESLPQQGHLIDFTSLAQGA
ncbi:MAG: DUF434 domain-containing protein [Deltaproteobacteria bacterium]|nr:MAG: DUF434 domain-containing protein [Deltaproteobacteria bacterium]